MTPQEEKDQKDQLTSAHTEFTKGLSSYAFSKVRSRELSTDLVQDTFIKTWSYLVRGGKVDVMKSFLYHILNNLIVDEYRKRKHASLDALLAKGFDPGEDTKERLVNALDGKSAIILIQRLPAKYQPILRMRFVQDLTLDQMATITGETKNTLAVQIHRGVSKLKSLYFPKE